MSVLKWTRMNTYSPPDPMTGMSNSMMISHEQEEPEEYCVTGPHG